MVNLLGNEILHLVGDEEAATATPTATTPPGATATPTTTPTTTPDPTGTVTVTATVAPTATPVWSHRGYLPAALGSPADEPPPMPAAGRGGPTGHQGGRR